MLSGNIQMIMIVKPRVPLYGKHNSWSTGPFGNSQKGLECDVELTIIGNEQNVFHLVMSPEGFFTADYWFATKAEAISSAFDQFGVPLEDWTTQEIVNPDG
jgi:hypothetical protein